MSTITMNNARSTHRAHIVAEAVISAYIHEIARPAPRPEPPRVRIDTRGAAAHSALDRRVQRRPLGRPRRWAEHELAA